MKEVMAVYVKQSGICALLLLACVISSVVAFHEIVGEPPSFTQEQDPEDQVVFATNLAGMSTNLELPCAVTGDPQPAITWFRNDDQMVDSQFVMSDGRLVIPNITMGEYADRDGVGYYCVASNIIGENNYTAAIRSRTANVTYAFFDGFLNSTTRTVTIDVQQGSSVALECDVADANPTPTIAWYDDPQEATELTTVSNSIIFLEGKRYLVIRELTALQISREYHCVVTNARIHQRVISPTTYTLGGAIPQNTIVAYKEIGDITAFKDDGSIMFSYITGANPIDTISECAVGGTGVFDQDGIANIQGAVIPDANGVPVPLQCREVIVGASSSLTGDGTLTVYLRAAVMQSPDDNREFVVGEQEQRAVMFECTAVGFPAPRVDWYFNGQQIDPDSGIATNDNTLTIAQPTPSHSGIYQCAASNFGATGMESWILEIREQEPPMVVPYNLTVLGATGDRDVGATFVLDEGTLDFELAVTVESDPCPSVQWTLNGTNITSGDDYTITNPCEAPDSMSPYTFRVTIRNMTDSTSGDYSAVFSALGSQATLPATFITIPRRVDVNNISLTLEGATTREPCLLNNSIALLRCNVEGFPRPQIIFRRGTTQIEPGEPGFERYSQPFFDELKITGVDMSDDGNAGYGCEARDSQGIMLGTAEAVLRFCTVPVLIDSRQTEDPRIGQDFEVECTLMGIPDVEVDWMKDGQVFVSSQVDNANILIPAGQPQGVVSSIVSITNAVAENNGVYTCNASNLAGEVSMNFRIEAQGSGDDLPLPLGAIIGIAAGGAGLIILIVLIVLLGVCIYQCASRSKKGSMDMPPPYSGKMYTDYSDGRGNVDDSDGEEEGQPEAFNPQYESLPALRPSQPPGYRPTPSYPHGADDMEMMKMPPPDTDSFVGGAPPYMKQDNNGSMVHPSYRPSVDDFLSEDAQFV